MVNVEELRVKVNKRGRKIIKDKRRNHKRGAKSGGTNKWRNKLDTRKL